MSPARTSARSASWRAPARPRGARGRRRAGRAGRARAHRACRQSPALPRRGSARRRLRRRAPLERFELGDARGELRPRDPGGVAVAGRLTVGAQERPGVGGEDVGPRFVEDESPAVEEPLRCDLAQGLAQPVVQIERAADAEHELAFDPFELERALLLGRLVVERALELRGTRRRSQREGRGEKPESAECEQPRLDCEPAGRAGRERRHTRKRERDRYGHRREPVFHASALSSSRTVRRASIARSLSESARGWALNLARRKSSVSRRTETPLARSPSSARARYSSGATDGSRPTPTAPSARSIRA